MELPDPRRGIGSRLALHRAPADAHARAAGVRARLVAEAPELRPGDAHALTPTHLRRLFELYDAAFFDDLLQQKLRQESAQLEFGFSNRLRTSAGRTIRHAQIGTDPRRYTLEIGTTPLLRTFVADQRRITVNGRACDDRLDAALRVFEHELIHLLEFLEFEMSDCGAKQFSYFAHRVFGHTDTTHRLATPSEWARGAFSLTAGSSVAFEHGGTRHVGVLNRVTKRATVLVPAEDGRLYSDGQRYRKFYVPLESLERLPDSDPRPPRG